MLRKTSASCVVLFTIIALVAIPQLATATQLEATPVPPTETPTATPEPIAPETPSTVPESLESAGDYCLIHGGILVERFPFVGTSAGTLIQLGGSRWFCEFTGSDEAEPPTSRISVGLSTLYSTEPTLATIAYLAAPSVPEADDDRLAAQYCAYLGGSSEFGSDGTLVGGWASDPSDPSSTSIGICIFADGSAIDDWGLAYHSNGVIRGADLKPLFRYQPESVPDYVFPQG
jgi:putative hemolysin